MNSRTISFEDVCRLIESCHRNGVAELTFGKLRLVFRESKPAAQAEPVTAPTAAIPQEVLQAQETVTKEAEQQESQEDFEERLDLLLLEKPHLYEAAVGGMNLEVAET